MITYYSILNFMDPYGTPIPIGFLALSQPQVYFKIMPEKLHLIYAHYPYLRLELEQALKHLCTSISGSSQAQEHAILFENHGDIDLLYLVASYRSGALQFSSLQFREGKLTPELCEISEC